MSPHRRVLCIGSVVVGIALHASALAAPISGSFSPDEHPGNAPKQPPTKGSSYGLCEAPQNADDFPSSPVPVEPSQCFNTQTFSAMSNTPSTGGSCGGFTVAFGPLGDLKPYLDNVTLAASWGDIALTQANCAKARLAAVGWGARCSDDACTSAQWEKIGGPQQRPGFWNTTSQVCYIGVSSASAGKKYKTLNLDVIATVTENGQTVRKRAKVVITARRGNGHCPTINQKQ